MWLPLEQFRAVLRDTVLVALDLIIIDQGRVLLGKRKHPPAQHFWFVPGGRVRKGEALADALKRISSDEVGVALGTDIAVLQGIYEHVYPDNVFGEEGLVTHYVVIACRFELRGLTPVPDQQHESLAFVRVEDMLSRDDVHEFTKSYFRWEAENSFLGHV